MNCSVEKGCRHYLVRFLKSKQASVFHAHLGLITHPHYLSVPAFDGSSSSVSIPDIHISGCQTSHSSKDNAR